MGTTADSGHHWHRPSSGPQGLKEVHIRALPSRGPLEETISGRSGLPASWAVWSGAPARTNSPAAEGVTPVTRPKAGIEAPGPAGVERLLQLGQEGRRAWRVRPEGMIAAFLFVWAIFAAISSGANLMALLGALIAGALLVGYLLPLYGLRGVRLACHLPDRAFAGRAVPFEVVLRNERKWRGVAGVGVRLGLGPPAAQRREQFFGWVGLGQSCRWSATVEPPRRGVYHWSQPVLVCTYPFGFAEYSRVADPELPLRPLLVHPPLGELNLALLEQQLALRVASPQARAYQTSREQEFRGLRGYREGDSARWIHWPTSARRGELMVREFEIPNEQHLVLVFLPWVSSRSLPEELERIELGASFLATVVWTLGRRPRLRISLLIGGESTVLVGQDAAGAPLGMLLDALALVQGTNKPDLRQVQQLLHRFPSASTHVLLVTTTNLEQLAREQADALPYVPRSRLAVINLADRRRLLQWFLPPAKGLLV
jgi:uncharacterized protein (DUF58 family)